MRTLQPAGWPRPKGYANGIEAAGRTIFVAGQIGWDETETFVARDFAGQFEQALRNILAVLAEADAGPEHIVRLTWFITDKQAYLANAKQVGAVYREVMGRNFPVMSVVEVRALMEDEALLEIEATAVIS
ncbi:RidA family protein [Sphingomonas sp. KC8]|uniref:RidA family protein n=1 Tax=Sphingomonas sp. KC8 TaxID=1030157 RepID=UPI000248AB65|nr:RidA family protein [Sphingomonas sp. KC8]ARS27288.1 endoribonuclease L-PSP [Sphingomonas sp. KC8]